MNFTCSSRMQFSQKSQNWGPVWAEPRASRSKRAWVRFFSGTVALPWSTGFHPTHLRTASCMLEEGAASTLLSYLQEMLAQHPAASSLPTCKRSGPRPPEPHFCDGNRSPEEVSVGNLQVDVDWAVDRAFTSVELLGQIWMLMFHQAVRS